MLKRERTTNANSGRRRSTLETYAPKMTSAMTGGVQKTRQRFSVLTKPALCISRTSSSRTAATCLANGRSHT